MVPRVALNFVALCINLLVKEVFQAIPIQFFKKRKTKNTSKAEEKDF